LSAAPSCRTAVDTARAHLVVAATLGLYRFPIDFISGLSLETLIVIPAKTGIQLFQQLTGFPLARERRKAKVLYLFQYKNGPVRHPRESGFRLFGGCLDSRLRGNDENLLRIGISGAGHDLVFDRVGPAQERG
jgi:hypothetical protein